MFFVFLEMVILLISAAGANLKVVVFENNMNLGVFMFISIHVGLFILFGLLWLIMPKEESNKELEAKS